MGVKVRERPGKGWGVFISWRKQRKAKFFGANKKAAQAFAEKIATKLKWEEQNGGSYSLRTKENAEEKAIPTVEEYLTQWKDTYAKVQCKPSTYRGYARSIAQHLIPVFGSLPLDQVTRELIRHFIAGFLKNKKARGTIENCLVPFKAMFYQAIDDGLVSTNPVARVGKFFGRRKERKGTIGPLVRKEVSHLIHVAHEQFPYFCPLLLCAVRTGMRQGELIGLQWRDVDFHGEFIEVRRGVVLRQETTTKSHKIRRVDMSRQLHKMLHQLKEVRQLETMSREQAMLPWVFLSPGGKRWDDRHLRRIWQRCLMAAGIRHVRFHDLRHTYASELAAQGAPPKYIQNQLGHSSIQITMDVYAHFFEKRNREWVDRLDERDGPLATEEKNATPPQPILIGEEHRTDKLLKNMVAVEGFDPPARGL